MEEKLDGRHSNSTIATVFYNNMEFPIDMYDKYM